MSSYSAPTLCGQIVYSGWKSWWIACVSLSTASQSSIDILLGTVGNLTIIHTFIRRFYRQLSTPLVAAFLSVSDRVFPIIHTTYYYLHKLKKGKK